MTGDELVRTPIARTGMRIRTSPAERLLDFPQSGRTVPEFERPDLREIILGV